MTHQTLSAAAMGPRRMRAAVADRAQGSIVALIAFLTLVDLFATQAILPSLARVYRVTPAAMGFAVNATTIGMAVSSLAVAVLSQRIDRKLGAVVCLAVLAIPTSLLAIAPDLMSFTGLRIAQGLCMAGAFTLTLAYLGEHFMGAKAAPAFAAYITGNVASNFVGRLMSAALADHFGIAANFVVFAVLNLSGALLVYLTLERAPQAPTAPPRPSELFQALGVHLSNPRLVSAFAIGFCILFAFIGVFTYVNFVLARPPIGLGMMAIGFVYFVFMPSMFTTPAAGGLVRRFGIARAPQNPHDRIPLEQVNLDYTATAAQLAGQFVDALTWFRADTRSLLVENQFDYIGEMNLKEREQAHWKFLNHQIEELGGVDRALFLAICRRNSNST